MATTQTGREAECIVAKILQSKGFTILERNWRTRRCEIDIIAQKSQRTYFIEVKYRSNAAQGSGFDYITLQKQRQIRYAAQTWIAHTGTQSEYIMLAASVTRQSIHFAYV